MLHQSLTHVGKVYNVTRFLKYHPGRKAQLMRGAGVDSTKIYDKVYISIIEHLGRYSLWLILRIHTVRTTYMYIHVHIKGNERF